MKYLGFTACVYILGHTVFLMPLKLIYKIYFHAFKELDQVSDGT
jgi:hypothetical protein